MFALRVCFDLAVEKMNGNVLIAFVHSRLTENNIIFPQMDKRDSSSQKYNHYGLGIKRSAIKGLDK